MELLTAAQMRAIEQAAIESGEVTGLELMERAGRGVVEAIFEEWPELAKTSHRAVVLCGPGNNGGDGFVVARLLKEWGWEVEVFLYGDPDRLPPDARTNHDKWAELGQIARLSFPEVSEAEGQAFETRCYAPGHSQDPAAIIVDALFGIGLTRPMTGLFHALGSNDVELGVSPKLTPARHVSIDVPSGLFTDDPVRPGFREVFLTELTVTFHAPKPVHVAPAMKPFLGKVVVKDIGL
jgi:hydroxyethylthiazole kinase-like uncharacterized protein yjeF